MLVAKIIGGKPYCPGCAVSGLAAVYYHAHRPSMLQPLGGGCGQRVIRKHILED
jgi:hypothetical protein